jgi:hypothetical protein
MAKLVHIRCHHCGELLTNRASPYCPPCNLYLCYRAMPILLGMLLPLKLPLPVVDSVRSGRSGFMPSYSYDDEPCIMVAYSPKKPQWKKTAAYEEELCIMVPY